MPRLRQVRRHETDDKLTLQMYDRLFGPDRDPVDSPGTATGTPGDWWTVFALSPDVIRHAVLGFNLYRSPNRQLDPVLRELGQTRAGWLRGSQFVFSQHCKSCRTLGMSDEKIAAIPAWSTSDQFSDVERIVLPTPTPSSRATAACPTSSSTAPLPPQRRADPRAHVHHGDVRDARPDLSGAAPRVRRSSTTRSSRYPVTRLPSRLTSGR